MLISVLTGQFVKHTYICVEGKSLNKQNGLKMKATSLRILIGLLFKYLWILPSPHSLEILESRGWKAASSFDLSMAGTHGCEARALGSCFLSAHVCMDSGRPSAIVVNDLHMELKCLGSDQLQLKLTQVWVA